MIFTANYQGLPVGSIVNIQTCAAAVTCCLAFLAVKPVLGQAPAEVYQRALENVDAVPSLGGQGSAPLPNLDFFPRPAPTITAATFSQARPARPPEPVARKTAEKPRPAPATFGAYAKNNLGKALAESMRAVPDNAAPADSTSARGKAESPAESGEKVAAPVPSPKEAPPLMTVTEIPNSPADRKALARKMLQQARELLARQDLDGAERLMYQLRELAVDFGRFGDNPSALQHDIATARLRAKTS